VHCGLGRPDKHRPEFPAESPFHRAPRTRPAARIARPALLEPRMQRRSSVAHLGRHSCNSCLPDAVVHRPNWFVNQPI
jgi:hypothetical protein